MAEQREIGSFLLNCLAMIAKAKGISGFTAEVMSDNRRMIDLFEQTGFRTKIESELGMHFVELYFGRTYYNGLISDSG